MHLVNRTYDEMQVGEVAELRRLITADDLYVFAVASGNTNPMHLQDSDLDGNGTIERVAPGMFVASLISAVLGTRLPGEGTIYLGQNLKFRAPVKIGDTVTATVTITALDEAKKRVTLNTVCTVEGKPVIEGEATVMVPSRG